MEGETYTFDPYGFHLFRRCVQCPGDPPTCPECKSDETCTQIAQSCSQCASTTCVRLGTLPGQLTQKQSTPVGVIVGGVLAGMVLIAVLIYLGHRLWFRKQRKSVVLWDPPEKRDQSTLHRSQRQSTRSAHSIASTVQTRASNVIQIAFIPGVTAPNSPDMMVPPVPAVPGATNPASAGSIPEFEQHFFMPGDLRDSTWSDTSSVNTRISLTPSLMRQSVATTIYRSDAIVPPIPAQQAFRAHANVVSVKNGVLAAPLPPTPTPTPPLPTSPSTPGGAKATPPAKPGSSIVGRNAIARPIEIKKGGPSPRVPTAANLSRLTGKKSNLSIVSDANTMPFYSDEKEVIFLPPSGTTEMQPLSPPQSQTTLISLEESAPSSPQSSGSKADPAGLNAMIADALNKAAKEPKHSGLGARPPQTGLPHKRMDSGPFSDANEVKESVP